MPSSHQQGGWTLQGWCSVILPVGLPVTRLMPLCSQACSEASPPLILGHPIAIQHTLFLLNQQCWFLLFTGESSS